MKPKNLIRTLTGTFGAVAAAAFLSLPAAADTGGVPQASLNLEGSSLSYCNTSQNTWSIAKTASSPSVNSGEQVTWTITATKNPDLVGPVPHVLCAEGTITIANSGAAPATVGNIVVNLQKQVQIAGKWRWVSAAANVANSFAGDAATSAKIVRSASAEEASWNASAGTNNYSVSGQVGTFSEGAASGSIEFTDATNNTLFSITPSFNVIQGAPVTLKYKANFNNALLNIPGGTVLRTEVIVTFGNAGGRGGSGASLSTGVDINGNSIIDASENNVRSVPVRLTSTLPAYVNCNNEVSLLDAVGGATGTAAFEVSTNNVPATTSASGSWTVVATLTGNGTVTNVVDLFSKEPYASDPCCDKVDETAESTVTVVEECTDCGTGDPTCRTHPHLFPPGFCVQAGQFCTFSQGGWTQEAHGNNKGAFRNANWAAVFGSLTSGPETGIPGASGFSAQFLGPLAVENYADNGTPGAFNTDHAFNGSSVGTTSAGIFGAQVLGQVLAIAYSDAGPFTGTYTFAPGYKNLMVSTAYGSISIGTLVGIANQAIGGGSIAPFGSISELNDLMNNLNLAFHECTTVSTWAADHITNPGN